MGIKIKRNMKIDLKEIQIGKFVEKKGNFSNLKKNIQKYRFYKKHLCKIQKK